MTSPRDPRPTGAPEPLEISEEEYRAAEQSWLDAQENLRSMCVKYTGGRASLIDVEWATSEANKAWREWQDAQQRDAADHASEWQTNPAYRRRVREREWD